MLIRYHELFQLFPIRNGVKLHFVGNPPSQAWFADLKLRENLRAAVREAVEGLGRINVVENRMRSACMFRHMSHISGMSMYVKHC